MSQGIDDLPAQIVAGLMQFLREVEGNLQIVDYRGFLNFIADHISEYPALGELIEVDMDSVVGRFEETGEIPPGIQLVGKRP